MVNSVPIGVLNEDNPISFLNLFNKLKFKPKNKLVPTTNVSLFVIGFSKEELKVILCLIPVTK
jgi:hypothetical protein